MDTANYKSQYEAECVAAGAISFAEFVEREECEMAVIQAARALESTVFTLLAYPDEFTGKMVNRCLIGTHELVDLQYALRKLDALREKREARNGHS